jgi:hypothetical protein
MLLLLVQLYVQNAANCQLIQLTECHMQNLQKNGMAESAASCMCTILHSSVQKPDTFYHSALPSVTPCSVQFINSFHTTQAKIIWCLNASSKTVICSPVCPD